MKGEPPNEHHTQPDILAPQLDIRALEDLLVERHGFDPLSQYVEVCWLPVLGPTATWLYRRLGMWAASSATGLTVDTTDLAASLGLGEGRSRNSLLTRAVSRLVRFDVARWDDTALLVRRMLPPLHDNQARKLGHTVYRFHRDTLSVRHRNANGEVGHA